MRSVLCPGWSIISSRFLIGIRRGAMWDATSIGVLVGTISAGAGTILGVVLTKGVDAFLRIRKAKSDEIMDEKKYDDSKESIAFQQATAAYEKLIQAFETRVKALEEANLNVHAEL